MRRTFMLVCALAACQTPLGTQGGTLLNHDYVGDAVRKQQEDSARQAASDDEYGKIITAARNDMDIGEYARAESEFKRAYELRGDAGVLVMVGDAERAHGDCPAAQDTYTKYLDKTKNPPDAQSVRARRDKAAECVKNGHVDEVRKYYDSGQRHFNLGEWDLAVGDFKEAYRLSGDSTYLLMIAQTWRKGKNCSEALTFYQRYQQVEQDPQGGKDKLQERVDEMKACSK